MSKDTSTEKIIYKSPHLDIYEFAYHDIITSSDDDVIELPKQEFSW